jgi:nitroimidazol reductase NimA-like FMN-containing flavoprotein (pyridoxamine 5'-phosphate oxidase superfamily)
MPPLRRNGKEIRNPADIEAVIRRAMVIRLGFADDGSPYVVPVCFGYEPGIIWVHSAREGRKIGILKKNPRVCFEIDEVSGPVTDGNPCEWGMRYVSVIGSGTAEFVQEPAEKVRGLTCIVNHYAGTGPCRFTEPSVRKVCVIRIRIAEMIGKRSPCC